MSDWLEKVCDKMLGIVGPLAILLMVPICILAVVVQLVGFAIAILHSLGVFNV